jgi:arylsulfatase A-like enzyme
MIRPSFAQLGWHNVGWHNKEMKTPNANALAKEGIILDKSYVFMYCAPTRSSIMSGRLPFRVNQVLTGMQVRNATFCAIYL